MPITAPLFLGLVAHPFVDDTLVDAGCSEIRRERVPESMEPPNLLPFAAAEGSLKVIMGREGTHRIRSV